jgi:hypothetical protein
VDDKGEPIPFWHPYYKATVVRRGGGEQEVMVEIPDIASHECPVSLVSRFPQIDVQSHEAMTSFFIQEATGAFPFGMDSNKWPCRWYDYVHMAEIEKRRITMAVEKYQKSITG